MKRHFLLGLGAALLLFLAFWGILALTQGPGHAFNQVGQLWFWVLGLAAGFGTQVGLYSFLRQGIKERSAAATASVATSGGVSTGSMVACCAHHLSDVLPLLGLSGLAVFLVRYQVFFIIAGLLSNIVGITIMLEAIQRHNLSQRMGKWQLRMDIVRKVAMISAVAILPLAFFLTV